MPGLIMTILGLIASARDGNDKAVPMLTQLGSALDRFLNKNPVKQDRNLTSRGFPDSKSGLL